MLPIAATASSYLDQVLRPAGIDTTAAVDKVRAVVADPSKDPRQTILIVGTAALALMLLVILVLLLVTPSKRRVVRVRTYAGDDAVRAREIAEARERGDIPDENAPKRRKPQGKVMRALTGPIPAVILVVISLVLAYGLTSTQYYCAQTCHAGSVAVTTAGTAGHADCRSCHEGPLVMGALGNASTRLHMVLVSVRGGQPVPGTAPVDSSSCLSCHKGLATKTSTSPTGLVMSHKAPIESGYPCTSCHEHTGHVKDTATATMSDCLPCHDGKKAAAECDTCHRRNPVAVRANSGSQNSSPAGRVFPAVRAAKRECTGCHDVAKKCDGCHGGFRMPHSFEFRHGGHARAAVFEGKTRCWRCHDPISCDKCHKGFDSFGKTGQHGANWKVEHAKSSWDAGCVCHSNRGFLPERKKPICILCHAEHYK